MFRRGATLGFPRQCENEFLGQGTHFVYGGIHLALVGSGLLHEVGLFSAKLPGAPPPELNL
jgi:hypothetical protein